MATIALVNPFEGGHHAMHLRLFGCALLDLGHDVLLACAQPEDVRERVLARTGAAPERVHTCTHRLPAAAPVPWKRLRDNVQTVRLWRAAARDLDSARSGTGATVDLVFFPWLDAYAGYSRRVVHRPVLTLFRRPWAGLYFHPRWLRLPPDRQPRRRRNWALPFRSPRCRAVAVLDEGVSEAFEAGARRPIVAFPDAADLAAPDPDYAPAREVRERAAGRPVVGLVGALARRKGVATLLDAADRPGAEDLFFLCAGRLLEHTFAADEWARVLRQAAAPPGNLFLSLGHIPDEPQFNALVAACDIVAAVYEDFPHSSNLLAKAAHFRRPVIVSRGHCMAERADRYRLGLAVPEGDPDALIRAVRTLLDPHGPYADRSAFGFEAYARDHSEDALRGAFARLLAHALPREGAQPRGDAS